MVVLASGAGAQEARYPPGAVVQPLPSISGSDLRDQLANLAANPESASALVGAGRAALAAGDTQAAIIFFGRAEELAPRDARAKAGIAEALVRTGEAEGALRYYANAVALGAPEDEIAKERGLAFDMVGDPRRAQQDYARVLRRGSDPEVERRLALSLAISGDRDAALGAIDDQLRRQDRAAWRTRAFVLALTGDWQGARDSAAATMPAPQVEAMTPFLAQLAALNPQQKAMAVHFGQFPSNGAIQMAARDASADRSPPTGAGAATPARSIEVQEQRVGPGTRPRPTRAARRAEAQTSPQVQPQAAPVRTAEAAPPAAAAPQAQRPAGAVPAGANLSVLRQPSITAGRDDPAPAALPPAVRTTTLPPSASAPVRTPTPSPSFSDIASAISTLPEEPRSSPPAPAATPPPARQAPSQPRAATPAPQPAASSPAPARAASPSHPSRHWVQIAGGADKSALPREFARLQARAPEQLGGRNGWTTPLRFTNRLLVGPFESPREAQEFVNSLARAELSAFSWTSPGGQEIERLPER